MRVISFHTGGLYAEESLRLQRSLIRYGVPHYIEEIEDRGQWGANVPRKANFILDCHSKFPGEDLIWIDADAVIHENILPYFWRLARIICPDFAAFFLDGRLQSGTMYWAGGLRSEQLARAWRNINARSTDPESRICPGGGQANLQFVLQGDPFKLTCPDLTTYELPPEYCFIFDLFCDKFPGVQPVIEHLQASREAIWHVCSDDKSPLDRRRKRIEELGR